MRQRMFTFCSAASLLVCVGAGVAYVATMQIALYSPTGPKVSVHTVPLLG